MKKDKDLKGSDIILNLEKIVITSMDSFSSSTNGGSVYFAFKNQTKHGYMEDPRMQGEIKVFKTRKEKGYYILKVKFKKDKDEY